MKNHGDAILSYKITSPWKKRGSLVILYPAAIYLLKVNNETPEPDMKYVKINIDTRTTPMASLNM